MPHWSTISIGQHLPKRASSTALHLFGRRCQRIYAKSATMNCIRKSALNICVWKDLECIKPVNVDSVDLGSGTIKVSDTGDYVQVDEEGNISKLPKAKITLNDCLACSGCITSAESILITQQSQETLLNILQQNERVQGPDKKVFMVSVSPQSRASLAVKYGLSTDECWKHLKNFFYNLGFSYVLDTTISREFSLHESCREFVARFTKNKCGDIDSAFKLPLLTSACPGWICYAEKTHGQWILPHISRVKSPQQIIGSLVKDFLASRLALAAGPSQVYHVTVMPCFDKKLEASRSDFYNDLYGTRDVDLVLSTLEVDEMIRASGKTLDDGVVDFDADFRSSKENDVVTDVEAADTIRLLSPDQPYTHPGGGSGGYLEAVFRYAAKALFNVDVKEVEYRTLRNQDLREVTLALPDQQEPVLRFASAYGFRNIQNIVQRMKRGKVTYDFVEIMACPSGCLNGGAQLKAQDGQSKTELFDSVNSAYNSVPIRMPGEGHVLYKLYADWLGGEDSEKCRTLLHTTYHAVPRLKNPLTIKW